MILPLLGGMVLGCGEGWGEEVRIGNSFCIKDPDFSKEKAEQSDRERIFHHLLLDPQAHFMHGKLVHEDTTIVLSVLDRYDLEHAHAMLRMKFDTIFAEREASEGVSEIVGMVKERAVHVTSFFESRLGKRVIIAAVLGEDGFYVREMFRKRVVRELIGKCPDKEAQ